MNPTKALVKDELDAIAWRMSAWLRQNRHTRRCRRCGAWLAVDQANPDTCSPCQLAVDRERSR